MTARQFWRLPRAERTAAYFAHPNNRTRNPKNGSEGPSLRAQVAFHNNYLRAFFDFADQLSHR